MDALDRKACCRCGWLDGVVQLDGGGRGRVDQKPLDQIHERSSVGARPSSAAPAELPQPHTRTRPLFNRIAAAT
jgi:hypothetical protein